MAQIALSAAANGVLCIERLAPIAGLDDKARDRKLREIGLDGLPEEDVRPILEEAKITVSELFVILQRLRTEDADNPGVRLLAGGAERE